MAKVIEHGAKDMTHITEKSAAPAVTEEDRDFIEDDEVEFPED